MKTYTLLLCLIIFSCSVKRQVLNNKNALYFYFDAKNKDKMFKYYSHKEGPIKYLYSINQRYNIIFTPKNEKVKSKHSKRIKISSVDTVNVDLKDFEWLNSYTANWRNVVKLRNSDKDMYIIEKDTLDNELYIINVRYIEEIE